MLQLDLNQIIQLVFWFIALIELILGLYILFLNLWNKANRHVSTLLILFAINSYAQGHLLTVERITQARLTTMLLAATTLAIQPGLLLIAIVLLKPKWLQGRFRWFWGLLYAALLLPIVLTVIDAAFNTGLWYTDLDPATYAGGFAILSEYANGSLAPFLRVFFLYGLTVVSVFPIAYIAFFDKSISRFTRNLAFVLLGTQLAAITANFILYSRFERHYATLVSSTIFMIGYAIAAFRQLISERRLQRGNLQVRLTVLVLVIVVPLLLALSSFVINRAAQTFREISIQRLNVANQSISTNIETWLALNTQALEELVTLPAIVSMDPAQQKPALIAMADAYPHMYLVSTIGLDGTNIARSDEVPLKYYGDRAYFQADWATTSLAFQTLIGKTSGKPAWVASAPIRDEADQVIGVGMFASTLEDLSEAIRIRDLSQTGAVFLVDVNDKVIAHSDPDFFAGGELIDYSTNPAVAILRLSEPRETVRYSEGGTNWLATVNRLENGWGVVVQQNEADLLVTLATFQSVVWGMVVVSVVMVGVLTAMAIRQAIAPIQSLTDTATAIMQGDLTRVAPVESEDEIGILARSFNQMTERLLDLIGGLEQRVADRTQDLERRSLQLQAAADVGRAASSLLDVNQLFDEVVYAIQERFNLYYVGLFLVDEQQAWAYLRAGTGEAGQAMLDRQHRIKIGQGMIGWCIENAEPRIAQEAGEDAVRLATAELPETRSEAAIPMRARGQVLGAFTIQDTVPNAFDESSIVIFQTMADLVSIAIDNARLFTESQEALETAQRAFGEMSRKGWAERIRSDREVRFRADQRGTLVPEAASWQPELEKAWSQGPIIENDDNGQKTLIVPIRVRNNVIGLLNTHKPADAGNWTPEEVTMVETIIEQLGVALESARLYEETQRRAEREQLTHQLTDRLHRAADIDKLMQTIIDEVGEVLGASGSFVQFGMPADAETGSGNENEGEG